MFFKEHFKVYDNKNKRIHYIITKKETILKNKSPKYFFNYLGFTITAIKHL